MKTMKKLIALTLAFVMVMALAIPGMAEDTPAKTAYDNPLTITGLAKGDKAHFYQVIAWGGESSGQYAGWKAVAPFDDVLSDGVMKTLLSSGGGITSELAGQLAKLATGNGTTFTVGSDGKAVLNNPAAGMWMALITPADADTVYNPVFISGDYQNVQSGGTVYALSDGYKDAVAKKSTLTLVKSAGDRTTVDSDAQHTVAIGDIMDFTVSTTIPGYGDIYQNPVFKLTDVLNGLVLSSGSIQVKVGGAVLSAGNYEQTASDGGYTINFDSDYLKTIKTPTSVTVTYAATVKSDAANAINQKDNEVTLEYSHNPNSDGDHAIKKDTTQHYTFTLDASGLGGGSNSQQYGTKTSELVKVGVDANGKPITETKEYSTISDGTIESWGGPLQGAVFGLFTNSAGTIPYQDKAGKNVTATTGSDGRMTFAGLDAGTYYLKEISAPAGFVTNSEVYKVDIVAKTKSVKVTETIDGQEVTYDTDILESYSVTITDSKGNKTEAAKYVFKNEATATNNDIDWTVAECVEHPFQFENVRGTELPSTGGIGTKIFYAMGAVLVIGAGIMLVSKKRVGE